MKTKSAVVLCLICALALSPVAAQAVPEAQALLLRSLLTEITTWKVVEDLDLSPQQMQALLPVAREVRAEHDAIEAERVRSAAAFEQGLRALREELLANNGVSEEAKAAVARAEAGWRAIEAQAEQREPERFRIVRDILTPDQVEALCEYRPSAAVRGGDAQALARAEELLARARQLSPEQLQRAPAHVRGLLPPGTPPERLRHMADEVRDIVTQARAMGDQEFAQRKGELAQRLVSLLPRRAAPGPRPMRGPAPDAERRISQLLLTPALATVLEAKLGIAEPGPVPQPLTYPEDLANVIADVRVLNLVNSLYLSPDQMRALSDIIRRAEAERAADKPQTEALLQHLIQVATDVRAQLAAGTVTVQAVEQARAAMAQGEQYKRQRQLRMMPYVDEVKQVLNQNQITLVSEFIPCLIPVRSLTNPERIGQAQDTAAAERMLALARAASEADIQARLPQAQARLEAVLRHKDLPTAEIEARMRELPRVIAEARAMSDEEFEVKKTELVQRIAPPQPQPVTGPALDLRIAEYLLSPNLLPIFEQRIAALGVASR